MAPVDEHDSSQDISQELCLKKTGRPLKLRGKLDKQVKECFKFQLP